MFFPVKMKKFSAIFLKEVADDAVKCFLDLGVVDLVEVGDTLAVDGVESATSRVGNERYSALRRRAESLLSIAAGESPGSNSIFSDTIKGISVETAEKTLASFEEIIYKIREKQSQIQTQIQCCEDISRLLARKDVRNQVLFYCGDVKEKPGHRIDNAFSGYPYLFMRSEEDNVPAAIAILKRDLGHFSSVVEEMSLSPETPGDFLVERAKNCAELRLAELRDKQMELQKSLLSTLNERREQINELWRELRFNELYGEFHSSLGRTRETVVFSGWVPAKTAKKITLQLRKECGDDFFIEWIAAEKAAPIEEIPVSLKNPRLSKPFEQLVTLYDTPAYGSIDPTIIVHLLYVLMFGVMFGDIGQGFIILIAGVLATIKTKGKIELTKLLIWCGSSAMAFGIFFGSCFGVTLFPALLLNYHALVLGHDSGSPFVKSLLDVLMISVTFGVGVITFGLLLNWYLLLKQKRWAELFFDRQGIAGGWIYWGGIIILLNVIRGKTESVSFVSAFWLIGLPVFLLFLKGPVEELTHRKKVKWGASVGEWMIELLETFINYLSSTLSFMRLAGLGIAHVSLMITIFEIANLADSPIGKGVVFIIGNLIVIVLEGFSAGVQALRLNLYEFFSKFFQGAGRPYAPVSLKQNQ